MATRDLVTKIKVAKAEKDTAIDTMGFNSLSIFCTEGSAPVFALTDCDTSDGSYEAVADEFVIKAGENAVGYAGTKRYVKFADSGSGTAYAMVLGHPVSAPVEAE